MTRAVHSWNWLLWRRRDAVQTTLSVQQQWLIGILVIVLLFSAFSVIYLKDLSRRLFIQYRTLQQVQATDEVEWNKLLLEKGAWSTQSRIQYLATQQLNMIAPSASEIQIIH
ncbi:MAG: cell division protein FtsL [Gammaproteobacteria bacterium RIFCSPLOWO2_02_FULL_42_14]|nr:MAG: cell division protein FtsL [Gammaproteobacteria bacterium RIFCSPHIGHO2_02_FULL_42_43]OGT29266.1 MAG: cell division protein FtsL [Gammaproteobacteria bacterium RIFCSPHIGHO2_01_FULL_42_8]OGT50875.1 MAG: cell division protein FtsL [Gammaproteobacteria bacterium RIFCSPHIGHO2_12_FULL_41_25]OGT62530.1 MAG: cell division protein FtsL [Gammaproteobacteria bacterium RIFCSPLOWO2_02_FULL_42_14]OGT86514.1 MAG: cell division protein FtsL [Gammaproteobacteria bacterium RIFCSPLOWO2_12_FULL_42_18]